MSVSADDEDDGDNNGSHVSLCDAAEELTTSMFNCSFVLFHCNVILYSKIVVCHGERVSVHDREHYYKGFVWNFLKLSGWLCEHSFVFWWLMHMKRN